MESTKQEKLGQAWYYFTKDAHYGVIKFVLFVGALLIGLSSKWLNVMTCSVLSGMWVAGIGPLLGTFTYRRISKRHTLLVLLNAVANVFMCATIGVVVWLVVAVTNT